ncbi:hypothetical protein EV421DRAFT_1895775 [Armillaria borealis]|uniref:FAD-binding FR-type domain-containing protein n=1 Tax=Armillaria borealis TaxID=47425 RepID=A0AA39N397_9AGAR|nr:hypothetical protein EV421DRAFT_1895775 [Armillaria borealis]
MAPITTGIGNGVNAITDEYPHQLVWWLVNCFYAFIAICQLASFLAGKYQLRHKKVPVVPESNKTQLTRLPLAFLDFYRILSIRDTVGVEYYSLNVAEVFLACVYIVSPLIREYINSTLADGTLSPIFLASQFPLVTKDKLLLFFGSQQPKELAEVGVVVNLRKGFTHRLAVIVPDKGTIKVLFDGLYGPFPDVGSFNSAIFVAGPGVSYMLPLLLDSVE